MRRARSRGTTASGEVPGSAGHDAALAKGARITGDSRDRLRSTLEEQYAAGASIRALAEQTGRSYGFVHKVLVESKIPLRTRGGPNRKKSTRPDQ